jgi:hypothetical protein
MANARGKRAKARALLADVDAACAIYRHANGVFPSWDPVAGSWMGRDGEANAEGLRLVLASVDPDRFRDPRSLHDPWGSVLRYRPARVYEFDATRNVSQPIAGDDAAHGAPPNVASYQLWSIGPDRLDQIGDARSGDGDDLANWQRP